jgi:hypothetical protein
MLPFSERADSLTAFHFTSTCLRNKRKMFPYTGIKSESQACQVITELIGMKEM